MNHKRRRPKNRRAGCLYCKTHKANGVGAKAATRARDLRKQQDSIAELTP